MRSRAISRGLPPSASGAGADCARGRSESRPLPRARRLISVVAIVVMEHSSVRAHCRNHLKSAPKAAKAYRAAKNGAGDSVIRPKRTFRSRPRTISVSSLGSAGALNVIARQEFVGELEIGIGPARPRIVERHWLAVARSFRKAHVAWNDGLIKQFAKIFAERLGDLLGQVGSVVVHGQQDTFDGQVRVIGFADALEGGNQ